MKLGVDFGTNRIVVAAADRGNYPLVSFEAPDGASPDWFPSLIAIRGDERLYGWDAYDRQSDEAWTVIRSIKRLLEDAGPQTFLDLGDQKLKLTGLLDGLTSSLLTTLQQRSNLRIPPGEALEIVLGVPAHANSNQRFLSVESFRNAGFQVLGVLNEPSAASIEFGHRQRQSRSSPETILVYDLGGGTFDASLVTLDENVHHVVASEGIPTIGGDDFDQILAELALEVVGIDQRTRENLPAAAWFRLLEECRHKKEALNPNSRRITIDLEHAHPGWQPVCGEKRTAVQLSYSIHCLRRGSAYLHLASRVSRSAVLIRRFITSVIFAFSNALIVRRLVHQAVKSPFGTRSGFHSILPWRVHPTCTLQRLPTRRRRARN